MRHLPFRLTLLVFLWLSPESPAQITWTRFAGGAGGAGHADGQTTEVRLNSPCGVAVDQAGNAYVADTANHVIRKITPSGMVTTHAGIPRIAGHNDGPRETALFNSPRMLVIAGDGSLYVTDSRTHTIRRISAAGEVTTLAGQVNASGFTQGTGAAAKFNSPYGIAWNIDGSLAISDTNGAIRRVSLSGEVSVMAGASSSGYQDGDGSLARFSSAFKGLASDSVGNVYVADGTNHVIRKIDVSAQVTTVAGLAGTSAYANGPGASARFSHPRHLAMDAEGNLWVGDGSTTIRKIDPAGTVSTVTGRPGEWGYQDGSAELAKLSSLPAFAPDPSGGMWVTDAGSHLIRKASPQGVMTTLAGVGNAGSADGTGEAARFWLPDGIAVDSEGVVFVSDRANNTIRRISPGGEVSTLAGQAGQAANVNGRGSEARFSYPRGLSVDATGNLFIADRNNRSIRKVTPTGQVTTHATGLSDPTDVVIDQDGVCHVAEFTSDRISRISENGQVSVYAGLIPSTDSPHVPQAGLINAIALARGPGGMIFAIDYEKHSIRRILMDNSSSLLAGTGVAGSADGAGNAASFSNPVGIAADPVGNVFVADSINHTIRKITTKGVVSTIGGTTGWRGDVAGIGTAALFNEPTSIAVGPDGTLYVANKSANSILKGVVSGPEITVSREFSGEHSERLDSSSTSDAGTVSTGDAATLRFTLDNEGLSSLAGIAVTIEGTDATDFTVIEAPDAVLMPHATDTLRVRFSPATAGSKNAVLHLASGDSDEPDFTILLTGNAVPASPTGELSWRFHTGAMLTNGPTAGSENGPAKEARFRTPSGIAIGRTGAIYVADSLTHAIRKIDAAGQVSTVAGQVTVPGNANGRGAGARFSSPQGVAVDDHENLYIADTGNHTIRRISPDGTVITIAGSAGNQGTVDGIGSEARFRSPRGIVFDSLSGRLMVADTGAHVIRAVTLDGVVTTLAGLASNPGATDGAASEARFDGPRGIAVDAIGNILVCDTGNHLIRRITTDGQVSTLAGQADVAGNLDGIGVASTFHSPDGIALEPGGTIYVTDRGSHVIRRISVAGAVTTIGGTATTSGRMEGVGTQARFNQPAGIAVAPDGRLIVSALHLLFQSTVVGPEIAVLHRDGSWVERTPATQILAPASGMSTHDFVVRNAGSATLELTSSILAEEHAGSFAIEGDLPANVGIDGEAVLTARFSAGAAGIKSATWFLGSNDADESPFQLHLAGESLSHREFWRRSYFAEGDNDAADDADPDGDGLVNTLEYAFNLHPVKSGRAILSAGSGTSGLPLVTMSGHEGSDRLRIEYVRRRESSDPGVRYFAEFSSDLQTDWETVATPEVVEPIDAEWERVIVEDLNNPSERARFGRVRLENE